MSRRKRAMTLVTLAEMWAETAGDEVLGLKMLLWGLPCIYLELYYA